ncbi:MAG: tetratricopeptide repeat protein [Pirellulales bacterium]|nr:tetratricopeptide repeat protein [Pirellulales bacterium]
MSQAKRYFDALTGVRAAMMYLVFLCHYNFVDPRIFGEVLYRFSREFHVGVPVFYVLSGFLIYYRYGHQLTRMSWRWGLQYLQNRAARIYPIYFFALTYTYLVRGLPRWFDHGYLRVDWRETLVTYTLTQSFFPDLVHKGIAQAWTLTIEETFYFLAPVLFLLAHLGINLLGRGMKPLAVQARWAADVVDGLSIAGVCFLVGASGVALAEVYRAYFPQYDPLKHVYGRTLCGTIACFGSGMYLARVVLRYGRELPSGRRPYWTYLGACAAIGVVFITSQLWVFVDPATLSAGKVPRGVDHPLGAILVFWVFPVFVASTMWGLMTEESRLRRVLGHPLLVLLGGSSYVFYLIHLGVVHDQIQQRVTENYVLRFLLLNLIAVTGFVLVERPANLFLKHLGHRRPEGQDKSTDGEQGFLHMSSLVFPWPVYLVIAGIVLTIEMLPRFLAAEYSPSKVDGWLFREDGVYESAEAVLCLLGAVAFLWIAARVRSGEGDEPPQRNDRIWHYVFGAVCIFMFGEEISWGQRLLGFSTPDWMNRQNFQGEFTLHNMKVFQPGQTTNVMQATWLLGMLFYLGILPWARFAFAPVRELLDRWGIPVPSWPIALVTLGWFIIYASGGYTSSEVLELVIVFLFGCVAAESFFRFRGALGVQEARILGATLAVVAALFLVSIPLQGGDSDLPSVRSMNLTRQAADEYKENNLDDARQHYEEALKIWEGNGMACYGLGRVLMLQGDTAKAIEQFGRAVQLEPEYQEAKEQLALAYWKDGRVADAIRTLQSIIAENEQHLGATNFLAWLWATTPDQSLRNGKQAVELARRVCNAGKQTPATYLDTLAAALAETGDFESAISTARRAVQVALEEGNVALAAKIQDRVALYEIKQPYREVSGK